MSTLKISKHLAVVSGVLACALLACSVGMALELDPTQRIWIKKYQEQENAPKPEAMLLNTEAEPALEEGFTPLFNGTDLTGWKAKGGASTFEVKEGKIVGACVPGEDSTYLCTEKADYTDFVFTCDLKWEVDGNTGIQFRSKARPAKGNQEEVYGPQLEMEGKGKGNRHWSGGIYGQSCGGYFYPLWLKEHRAARAATKTDDWNRITISAQGNVLKTWINGVPVAHWVDTENAYSTGFFGLQIHKGQAGTVLFKNLRIKELSK